MLINCFKEVQYRTLLITGFALASIHKRQKSLTDVKLPAPDTSHAPHGNGTDSELIQRVIGSTDALTAIFLRFTPRKCFFRAFTAGYVLRKKGIDVTLNMGLNHLSEKDHNVRGHCWLSWQGQPVGEDNDPLVRYDSYLGKGQNGICYWLGGENTAKPRNVRYRSIAKGP